MDPDLTATELEALRVPLNQMRWLDPRHLEVLVRGWLVPMVCGARADGLVALVDDSDGRPVPEAHVEIDIGDDSSADRVARGCALEAGMPLGCTAPSVLISKGHLHLVALTGPAYDRWVEHWPLELLDWSEHDPDPEDPRRLPSGARYVERLALARLAIRVHRVESTKGRKASVDPWTECECDLRDRRWNLHTRRCETCGRSYRRS